MNISVWFLRIFEFSGEIKIIKNYYVGLISAVLDLFCFIFKGRVASCLVFPFKGYQNPTVHLSVFYSS